MVEEDMEMVGSGVEVFIVVVVEDSLAMVVEDADVALVNVERSLMASVASAESMDTCRRIVGAMIRQIWHWVKWP